MTDADAIAYIEAVNYFSRLGWTNEQAEAVLKHGLRKLEGDRQQKFLNFCGLHEMDPHLIEPKLHWLHEELVGPAEAIGQQLSAATTVQEAEEAIKDFYNG